MEILICALLGYMLGSLSPATAVGKLKKKSLSNAGTNNLGATNTMIVFGKWYGILVMIIDILKSYVAVKLAKVIFPQLAFAGLVAGAAAVIGHIFPIYTKFKGGKGLAAYGGMVLAYSPKMFLFVVVLGFICVFLVNYGLALPVAAAVITPILVGFYEQSVIAVSVVFVASAVMVHKHRINFERIQSGEEIKFWNFVSAHLRRESKG